MVSATSVGQRHRCSERISSSAAIAARRAQGTVALCVQSREEVEDARFAVDRTRQVLDRAFRVLRGQATQRRISFSIHDPTVRSFICAALNGRYLLRQAGQCGDSDDFSTSELECYSKAAPDLMILDVISDRKCSCIEVAHRALARWPGVKILLTSATPPAMWPPAVRALFSELLSRPCVLLPMPFTAQQLWSAIRDLLAGE